MDQMMGPSSCDGKITTRCRKTSPVDESGVMMVTACDSGWILAVDG